MPWILPAVKKLPSTLGVTDGKLADCPASPNCVSSQSSYTASRVPSLAYTGEQREARDAILRILAADSRAELVTVTDDYVHATFRAFVFLDDVEFYFPADEQVVHVRSASRVGHSDLGANRRRVRAISAAFSSQQ